MEVPKIIKECGFHINDDPDGICIEKDIIDEMRKYIVNNKEYNVDEKDVISNKDVISTTKKIFNCETESCILIKPEIKSFIGEKTISNQLEERFKPEGPYNSKQWFSNHNIDNVLKQVAIKYNNKKFLHIKFQMRDFAKQINNELYNTDFSEEYKKGIRCFGVVFNTDYSHKNGQHWFCVFGDFSKEPFTIEYFNSSGDDPLPEIDFWMKSTKNNLIKNLNFKVITVDVTKIDSNNNEKIINQSDNHSCGSYSLYYIISRLEGIPYEYFSKNKIGDEKMHIFREYYLFRQPK